MATSEAALQSITLQEGVRSEWRVGALACLGLTAVALPVHGYHPYAEDGGVYIAGLKYLLHPKLYMYWTGFATAHLRYELFAPMLAALVRASGMSVASALLLVYLTGIWATLFAGWLLMARCTGSRAARLGAVSLLALTLTIPVAGTSLIFNDPYVTARSIATPCGLFALVAALDAIELGRREAAGAWKAIAVCCGWLLLAALVHPLMAGYSLGCVLLLIASSLQKARARWTALFAIGVLSFAGAAVLDLVSPKMSAAYLQVARTRDYWFLSTWHWYEQLGVIAPLLLLWWLARSAEPAGSSAARSLARMAAVAGGVAMAVALAFARESQAGSLVARLQPLRVYETIYALLILAAGAWAGERLLRRSVWRWTAMFCVLGGVFYSVQAQTFPHSGHVELPGAAPTNPWEQGFLWIRTHTPIDGRFALDANYIAAHGEDAQNFRADAERSSMPDYAKDGGIASIAPDLTPAWEQGEVLGKNLDEGLGQTRIKRLRAAGVDWVVLTASTPTTVPCPYANAAIKVCRLPQ